MFIMRFVERHTNSCYLRLDRGSSPYIRRIIVWLLSIIGISLSPVDLLSAAARSSYAYCIMINPAGDAEHTGRKLNNHFERGLTLQCAELIKHELELNMPQVRVILTRTAGQSAEPLQYAQFANKLSVDLYIHLSFYKEKKMRSSWYLYTYFHGDSALNKDEIPLLTYDQAYRLSMPQTQRVSNMLHTHLSGNSLFDVHGPYQLPYAPLIGIARSACGLEIGLHHDEDWKQCASTLVHVLQVVIENL